MITHIKYLLRFHDCVIIPGLGGLISHYEHARRNISTGTISPPSKKIAFNPALKRNDGLLIDHLIKQEGIDYTAADARVLSFKLEIEESLKTSGAYLLEGVGKLTAGGNKTIQFHPIIRENMLLNSFGLTIVAAKPIERIKEAYVERQVEEAESIETKAVPMYKPWYFNAAAAVGLIFIVMTSFLNLYNSGLSSQQFSLLPNSLLDNSHAYRADLIVLTAPEFTLNSESTFKTYTPEEIIQEEAGVQHVDDKDAYFIVVGSFLDKDRLSNEITAMENMNYQVATKPGPNGYTRVALVFDKHATSAGEVLSKVRKEVNPQAWIPR